ncbi:MAG: hypothetical protein L6V85_05335 [Clostridiales bacterium]|nr:MAG: hypothetical protein L6V85_05335 [Clostridiales bacterium]
MKDADYVVNLAAVIPPDSDHAPELTRACNVTGVQNLVKAVESMQKNSRNLSTLRLSRFTETGIICTRGEG